MHNLREQMQNMQIQWQQERQEWREETNRLLNQREMQLNQQRTLSHERIMGQNQQLQQRPLENQGIFGWALQMH